MHKSSKGLKTRFKVDLESKSANPTWEASLVNRVVMILRDRFVKQIWKATVANLHLAMVMWRFNIP